MHILMVLTSHDTLGDTGNATGMWLEEFAAPYYVFKDAGVQITLASPKGGQVPIDPTSDAEQSQTDDTRRCKGDTETLALLASTAVLSTVDAADYDAVFYPGGHGPLWDLAEDKDSAQLIETFVQNNRPVAAVCHAPAVFRHTKNADGQPLVSGKRITSFTNSEEAAVGLTNVVPFLLEDMLQANGALFEKGEDWDSYTVVDGLIITGQNPASSAETAQHLLSALR